MHIQGCIFFQAFEKLPGATFEKLPDTDMPDDGHFFKT